MRQPYGNGELFVLPLNKKEVAGGNCFIDSTTAQGEQRMLSPLNQETAFTANVCVDDANDEGAAPTTLTIKWEHRRGGSYDISVTGNPEGMATIVQPLPARPANIQAY